MLTGTSFMNVNHVPAFVGTWDRIVANSDINHNESGATMKDREAVLCRIMCSDATKSDRIRKLDEVGLARADIARALGVRYQFVRNVLVDDERRRASAHEESAQYGGSDAPRNPGSEERAGQSPDSDAPGHAERSSNEIAASASATSLPPTTRDISSARTTLAPGGHLTIPEPLLVALGIEDGDAVFLELEGDELWLYSRGTAIRQVQELVAKYVPPDVSLVDVLMAERRRESRSEDDSV